MTDLFNRASMKDIRRSLRQVSTESETLLWDQLRGRRFLGLKFKRQVSIGNFVVDFYCPSHELVIEVDGSIHDDAEVRENDKLRQQALESLGITVLRITNDEAQCRVELVLAKIKQSTELKNGESKFSSG